MSRLDEARQAFPEPGLLIGDEWRRDSSGGLVPHVNAHTGKEQAGVLLAGRAEIDDAVAAATAAFPAWRDTPADQRRETLLRIAALLRERAEEFVTLLILETGVIVNQARTMSTRLVAEFFSYYAGWCEKLEGAVVPTYPGPALDYTLLEPYGVVAAVIPWNGPLTPIGMKVAPALAAGNCVVLKPSEIAPFSSLRFAELCLDAGMPPGVLNVVPGGPEAGEVLVGHRGIGKVSFTGGGATGRHVLRTAAEHLTPVILELGGKSANIIFPDADLATAIPFAGMAPMMRSGQACVLPTRLLVHDDIYDRVVDGVVGVARSLRVGDPFDDATQMGPLVSSAHCARVQRLIDEARTGGDGELLAGGDRLGGDLANGFYVAPTVFGEVRHTTALAQEEVFGPVLAVTRFGDEDEALALANGTDYGLGAYLWTNDVRRAHRLARRVESGVVCVNALAAPANAPFGGVKQSGYGREGGRAGIDEFLRPKNVYVQL